MNTKKGKKKSKKNKVVQNGDNNNDEMSLENVDGTLKEKYLISLKSLLLIT